MPMNKKYQFIDEDDVDSKPEKKEICVSCYKKCNNVYLKRAHHQTSMHCKDCINQETNRCLMPVKRQLKELIKEHKKYPDMSFEEFSQKHQYRRCFIYTINQCCLYHCKNNDKQYDELAVELEKKLNKKIFNRQIITCCKCGAKQTIITKEEEDETEEIFDTCVGCENKPYQKACYSCYKKFKTRDVDYCYCGSCAKNPDTHKCQHPRCQEKTILQFCVRHY